MEDVDMVRFAREDVSIRNARVTLDTCGEVYHTVFPAFVPEGWDLDRADDAIRKLIPYEHCHHEYDCCGRFYGSRGRVMGESYLDGETKIVWVQRTYTQNV